MNLAQTNSRPIFSGQTQIHPRLAERVRRYLTTIYRRPIATHSQAAFEQVQQWINGRDQPLILDAGCGVGISTRQLAECFPQALVIGVDKSAVRLAKQHSVLPINAFLVRADLNDFWRQAVTAKWRLWHHYLLYPNPWPKAQHLQRRWHASPLLPFIVVLGGRLELRSNWRLYVEEFIFALGLIGIDAACDVYQAEQALTPFERKYWHSGQCSWHCVIELKAGYTPQVR